MKELITALKKAKAQDLVDKIVLLVNVEEVAEVLPDTPEKVEKLKTFLRVIRRLQSSPNIRQVIKSALKNVFYTEVLSTKIEDSCRRFCMGALTDEALRNEVYWHVKHQLHWIITQYETSPSKFNMDLDTPMLRGIITKF